MKKYIIGFIVVIILGVGYYALSPLWNNIELDEAFPSSLVVRDSFESMDDETRERFENAVQETKDDVNATSDDMPLLPSIIAQGQFVARAHDVKGEAKLIQAGSERIVRFENFETINGPDVRIYLSADLSDDDYVELSNLRATKGNVNYPIPAGVDTDKYRYVLVWCEDFSVLFSYAILE